jgi:RNA polymerase sigma-70 factor, ECF subfamily
MMGYEQFLELVTPHITIIQYLASALIGKADADDIVQETLLKAWQSRQSLRDVAAARTWLMRIAVNICHDWQRHHLGLRNFAQVSMDETVFQISDLPRTTQAQPGTNEHAAVLDLRSAVITLEEPLRVIVALRYFAGLDATEIGATLNVPPATVRTRLRRALAHLRMQMDHPVSLIYSSTNEAEDGS